MYTIIYEEIVDFGELDKMIEISGKVDKSNTYHRFSSSLVKEELLQTKKFFKNPL